MTKEQICALRERAVWKKLSSELSWTEELLTKYADQVDWKELSSNEKVLWTESLLRKFADNWIGRNFLRIVPLLCKVRILSVRLLCIGIGMTRRRTPLGLRSLLLR